MRTNIAFGSFISLIFNLFSLTSQGLLDVSSSVVNICTTYLQVKKVCVLPTSCSMYFIQFTNMFVFTVDRTVFSVKYKMKFCRSKYACIVQINLSSMGWFCDRNVSDMALLITIYVQWILNFHMYMYVYV